MTYLRQAIRGDGRQPEKVASKRQDQNAEAESLGGSLGGTTTNLQPLRHRGFRRPVHEERDYEDGTSSQLAHSQDVSHSRPDNGRQQQDGL